MTKLPPLVKFKGEINPAVFISVSIIKKFEEMFGKVAVREFYAELLGIDYEKELDILDEVSYFATKYCEEDETTFTSKDEVYKAYLRFNQLTNKQRPLNRTTFLKKFLSFYPQIHIRKNGKRLRGYRLSLKELS